MNVTINQSMKKSSFVIIDDHKKNCMVLFCVVDCYVRNPTSVFCFNTSNRVLATIKPFGKQSLQYLRYIHVSREPLLEFVPDISVHV